MNFLAPDQYLVISELPIECKENDLLLLAQTYGKVKSCELVRDLKNHGLSVSGIVSYYSPDSAEAAFRAFHGARFMGKILRTNWLNRNQHAASNIPAHLIPGAAAPKQSRTAQVHVSYMSKQLNFLVSEPFLAQIFGNFGTVVEVSLKKTYVDPEMSIQSGYGFVHFPLSDEGVKSALAAISNLDGITINHITLDCSISNQLKQILSNMEQEKSRKMFQQNGFSQAFSKPGFPSNNNSFFPQNIPQNMPQNFPQGLSQGLPQGFQQGLPQGLPQGLQQERLPQGLSQGLPPQMKQDQQLGPDVLGNIASLIHDYTSNPRANPPVQAGSQTRVYSGPGGGHGNFSNPNSNLGGINFGNSTTLPNDLRPPAPVLDVPNPNFQSNNMKPSPQSAPKQFGFQDSAPQLAPNRPPGLGAPLNEEFDGRISVESRYSDSKIPGVDGKSSFQFSNNSQPNNGAFPAENGDMNANGNGNYANYFDPAALAKKQQDSLSLDADIMKLIN